MEFVHVSINNGIAEARLKRGKVNALNEHGVEEIADCLRSLGADPDTRTVILTGDGSFFSFGFDIPEFLGYSRDSFAEFLKKFSPDQLGMDCYGRGDFAGCSGNTRCLSVHLSQTCRGCIERPCNCWRMYARSTRHSRQLPHRRGLSDRRIYSQGHTRRAAEPRSIRPFDHQATAEDGGDSMARLLRLSARARHGRNSGIGDPQGAAGMLRHMGIETTAQHYIGIRNADTVGAMAEFERLWQNEQK